MELRSSLDKQHSSGLQMILSIMASNDYPTPESLTENFLY